MAADVFNIALGKVKYYAELPASNDGIVLVLLKSSGLEAVATLKDHDTLAAVLAAANDECDATNYVRKVAAGVVSPAPDDTNNWWQSDMDDLTWTALGGATNNTLGKLIACYDPDTTSGTDSSIIPVTMYDITWTTDGSDMPVQINASGWVRAQ